MFAFLKTPAYRVEFERLLEACGFRIMIRSFWNGTGFENNGLKVGARTFGEPTAEMTGWRIAYRLRRKSRCCRERCLYRLAQPLFAGGINAGLGPAVCARCGRIERDYDGQPNGIGGLLGSATNAFPILDALMRGNEAYASQARLALLRRERQTLEERREVIDLEIAQLQARAPELSGDGPYRSALSAPPDNRAKALPALTEES